MGALLNPINRKRQGIKWGLVAHTTAMFSFVTINTAISLNIQNFSYVDKRGYPGSEGLPPGPFGYQLIIYSKPISVVPTLMFFLNNWLADGLLVSSVPSSVAQVPNADHSPALSLSHYLFHELLGHHLPLPDVHRFYWCVLELSVSRW